MTLSEVLITFPTRACSCCIHTCSESIPLTVVNSGCGGSECPDNSNSAALALLHSMQVLSLATDAASLPAVSNCAQATHAHPLLLLFLQRIRPQPPAPSPLSFPPLSLTFSWSLITGKNSHTLHAATSLPLHSS